MILYFHDLWDFPTHLRTFTSPGRGAPGRHLAALGRAWSRLAARSGADCSRTGYCRTEEEAAELLGIPEDVMQVGLLPVAYTLGTDFKPARRQPLDEVVHWEQW